MIAAGRRSKLSWISWTIRSSLILPVPNDLDGDAHRVGHADRVADLNLQPVGRAGGHQVLGDVAHHVGRGAVHLRRVLAREAAAAVAGDAAVGVHDDLAPGQAGVAQGPPTTKRPVGLT